MIKEAEVAQLHGLHVVARHEIAHPIPRLALLAARLLHLPGMSVGLRLEQPVGRPRPGARGLGILRARHCLALLWHQARLLVFARHPFISWSCPKSPRVMSPTAAWACREEPAASRA